MVGVERSFANRNVIWCKMKIENPSYENLVPFLGRHVSLTAGGDIHSGCLVVVLFTSRLWIGIDSSSSWYNRGPVASMFHADRYKFVGPKSISVVWFDNPNFSHFTVHEPIKNFRPGFKGCLANRS